jgi:hypothetical protein
MPNEASPETEAPPSPTAPQPSPLRVWITALLTPHWVTAAFTAMLALATLALVWTSIKQHGDAVDAIEATNRFANAAQQSADAAREANQISRDNLTADRRAWLGIIDEIKVIPPTVFKEDGATIRIEFTVKNFGRTPAVNVWMEAESFFGGGQEFREAWTRFKARVRAQANIGGPVIFPGDTSTLRLVWAVEKNKMTDGITVHNGVKSLALTVFAGTGYKIMADDTPHVTCGIYERLNIRIDDGGTSIDQPTIIMNNPFMPGEVD